MKKTVIKAIKAPAAIGTYSQAIKKSNITFLSGQIGLDPKKMILVDGIEAQIHQVFKNLIEVIKASNASIDDLVKLNIYLTDLAHFSLVNEIMTNYFNEPYPARAAIGVKSLQRTHLLRQMVF
jgi:reactive intermediate/imine deaminase